jgi:hypothetical protein
MMILTDEPATAPCLDALFNPSAGRLVVHIADGCPRTLAFPAARAALVDVPRDVPVWHMMGEM